MVSPTCSACVPRSSSSLSCIVLTSVSGAPCDGRSLSLMSGLARRPAPVVRVSVLLLGIRGVMWVPVCLAPVWCCPGDLSLLRWSGKRVLRNTKAADPVMSGSRPGGEASGLSDRWPPGAGASDIGGLVVRVERECGGDRDVPLDGDSDAGHTKTHAGGDGHSGPLALSVGVRKTDLAGSARTHGKDAG